MLASPTWHGGVIGIVASRLVERFHRPAILIAFNGAGGQGSGRSIPGFHLRDALAACAAHLRNFGGHAMAGGLRIDRERIDDFAAAFTAYAGEHIGADRLKPSLRVDAESTLPALGYPVVEHLARLAPFGQGNPPPVLAVRGCAILGPPRRMGKAGGVLSLMLSQNGASMRAVGFGMGELAERLIGVSCVDVAAEPTINTFNGRSSAELQLTDVCWEP